MQRGNPEGRSLSILRLKDLRCSRGQFSLNVPLLEVLPGQKVAVMGENGSGKSTLLALMAGFLRPDTGQVEAEGVPLHRFSPKKRARLIAFLPQITSVVFPFTVREVVLMGRYPHIEGRKFATEDHRLTNEVLDIMDLQGLSHRRYTYLSGGEQRRVMLARVLNQDTPLLLLDEPVAMLDSRHALMALSLLAKGGNTVIAVMHDINLALSFFQRFLFLKEGRVIYDIGKEEIDEEVLSEVYGVAARRCSSFCFTLDGGSCKSEAWSPEEP